MSATEPRSNRNAEQVERRRDVRLLHREGLSLRAIARRLGVAVSTVHRDVEAIGERPASPVNFPPAPVGNVRALKHGLDSSRVGVAVERRARDLVPGIIAAHGHLDDVRDQPAVLRYAMTLARLERAYSWLAEQDDELFADRDEGRVHGLLGRVAGWEAQAGREEERLAISPRERTRLKLDRLGLARAVGTGEDRLDFTGFTPDELDEYIRLRDKAAAVTAQASEVAA